MPRARWTFLLLLFLAHALTWPGPGQAADDEKQEDERPIVERIDWKGNDAISKRDLRAHILTQATRWPRFWIKYPYYEDELTADMERIAALYRQRGYYASVAEYEVEVGDDPKTVAVTIRIEEGEPVRVARLQIRFADGTDPTTHPLIEEREWEKLLGRLPLERDEIFELNDYRSAREKILVWLAELGFPKAQLRGGAEVNLADQTAEIAWTLELGPRVRLGEISIEGLEDVDRYIVEREIQLDPGEWYSVSAIAKTRRRIQNLALFRWTVVEALEPKESENGVDDAGSDERGAGSAQAEDVGDADTVATWPVSIRVTERPPRRVRIGPGWGTDTSFRAELSWHHRNFFGGARHMDVGVRYSGLGATFRPTFMEPYLLGTRTRLLVSPALVYESQDAYSARRILVDTSLQRDVFERWVGRIGYRFDRNDIYSVLDDPGEDELPEGISITTGPNIGMRRSTLDNPLAARKGNWIDLEASSSVRGLGSDEDFVRYTLDLRQFLEVYRTVLATRLLLGTIQTHGSTNAEDVPLVERFYSGGASSMRGFAYRALSPEDANGDSIGGSSVVEASVELRIPIWRSLGAVGFVDAAQVDPDPWKFRFDDLRYAAGPGLRYDTPAGPIRVDFAWRLNPADKRGKFLVSASLGHTF